jgi:two-component system OmpR family response regulator
MATILIVDDDIDIVNLFRIFLSREGHTTVTASDGRVCLQKLEQVHPDVILLDIMMAPLDGWETLTAIKERAQTNGIPVIMVTGKPLMDDERKKYGSMYHTYIMKPVRRPQLCEAVTRALNSRRT